MASMEGGGRRPRCSHSRARLETSRTSTWSDGVGWLGTLILGSSFGGDGEGAGQGAGAGRGVRSRQRLANGLGLKAHKDVDSECSQDGTFGSLFSEKASQSRGLVVVT